MVEALDVILLSTYFLLLFFSIFWLLVLFFPGKEASKPSKISRFPLCSVLVPAYNEEKSITETLQSIISLDYPAKKLEVIVINDGSRDKTQEKVELFIAEHPQYKIALLNQQNQGKGKALNSGLFLARGEFFACLDADSFVSPNALQEMLPYFETGDSVAAVCPLLKVRKPNSIIQKVQWIEYVINMFYKKLNAQLDCIHVTPGPFSLYRTKVIQDLGGYDEKTITEDLEIAMRLQQHHYKIIQTFDTTVETISPDSWKKLFKQRVRWYKGSVDNTVRYKNMMFNKDYGDFGFLRMPTIISSGIIIVFLSAVLFQDLARKSIDWFSSIKAINFDFWTVIQHISFDFNILLLPLTKLFIGLTLFGLSCGIMIYSYRLVQEKIRHYGRTFSSMITYLLVYGFFITVVWLYIALIIITQKRDKWS